MNDLDKMSKHLPSDEQNAKQMTYAMGVAVLVLILVVVAKAVGVIV